MFSNWKRFTLAKLLGIVNVFRIADKCDYDIQISRLGRSCYKMKNKRYAELQNVHVLEHSSLNVLCRIENFPIGFDGMDTITISFSYIA